MSDLFSPVGDCNPYVSANHHGKVLIVDDEPEVLLVLGKRLTSAGFEVIPCNQAEEAAERARILQPDLVILDLIMPGMDGVEVGRQIQACKETCTIPILFLSCVLTDWGQDQGDCFLPDTTYLSKPYHPEKLLEKVGHLVRRRQEMAGMC